MSNLIVCISLTLLASFICLVSHFSVTGQVSLLVNPAKKMDIPNNFKRDHSTSGREYAITKGFIGLSIEISSIMYFMEQEKRRPKRWFVQLLKNLKDLTGESPVIRLGGNSGDYSWYNPRNLPNPEGIEYSVNDDFLHALQTLSEELGTRWIFGLNFRRGDNSTYATDFASAIGRIMERKYIQGFQIGNEPDLYDKPWSKFREPTFTFEKYLKQIDQYQSDISRVVPSLHPSLFQGGDFTRDFLLSNPGAIMRAKPLYSTYTYHLYPLGRCDGIAPTIEELLSDEAVDMLTQGSQFIEIAQTADLLDKTWFISESNNVVCSGSPNISDTFASAIWALDWMFSAAYLGSSGIHFHGSGYTPYSAILIDQSGVNPYPTVMPQYYAFLMFSYMVKGYAQLLDIQVKSTNPNDRVKTWSVMEQDGTIHVLVMFKTVKAAGTIPVTLYIENSRQYMNSGELLELKAKTMRDKYGLSLAGQILDNTKTGEMFGRKEVTNVRSDHGSFTFVVDRSAASVFTLRKQV